MKTEVFAAIQSERDYHRLLWPRHTHTVGEWILIMEKCLSDARLAWVHGHGDDTHALSEIRQVTAVGVAAMEEHTPPLRELPKVPTGGNPPSIPQHWVHPVPTEPATVDVLEEELRVLKIDLQRYKDTLEALANMTSDSWALKQIHRALHPRPAVKVKGALKLKRRGKR